MSDELRLLQQRIERLEVSVGQIRDRLVECIKAASYPPNAIALARGVAESVTKRILENIGIKPPTMLDACLRELEKPEVMSRGLVPSEIITMLHMLRVMGNKAIHDSMSIQSTAGDVSLVLQSLLRIVEWYFSEFERGPKLNPLFCELTEIHTQQTLESVQATHGQPLATEHNLAEFFAARDSLARDGLQGQVHLYNASGGVDRAGRRYHYLRHGDIEDTVRDQLEPVMKRLSPHPLVPIILYYEDASGVDAIVLADVTNKRILSHMDDYELIKPLISSCVQRLMCNETIAAGWEVPQDFHMNIVESDFYNTKLTTMIKLDYAAGAIRGLLTSRVTPIGIELRPMIQSNSKRDVGEAQEDA